MSRIPISNTNSMFTIVMMTNQDDNEDEVEFSLVGRLQQFVAVR